MTSIMKDILVGFVIFAMVASLVIQYLQLRKNKRNERFELFFDRHDNIATEEATEEEYKMYTLATIVGYTRQGKMEILDNELLDLVCEMEAELVKRGTFKPHDSPFPTPTSNTVVGKIKKRIRLMCKKLRRKITTSL